MNSLLPFMRNNQFEFGKTRYGTDKICGLHSQTAKGNAKWRHYEFDNARWILIPTIINIDSMRFHCINSIANSKLNATHSFTIQMNYFWCARSHYRLHEAVGCSRVYEFLLAALRARHECLDRWLTHLIKLSLDISFNGTLASIWKTLGLSMRQSCRRIRK